jgi:hypothetical protein
MGGGCLKRRDSMKPLLLSDVAALVGGELVGADDPLITGAAGIEDAGCWPASRVAPLRR